MRSVGLSVAIGAAIGVATLFVVEWVNDEWLTALQRADGEVVSGILWLAVGAALGLALLTVGDSLSLGLAAAIVVVTVFPILFGWGVPVDLPLLDEARVAASPVAYVASGAYVAAAVQARG